MMKRSLPCTNSGSDISLAELKTYTEGWLLSCEIDQHSPNTITFRSNLLKKLVWFLERENCASCGLNELRKFFHYIQNGYKNPEGRWGNPKENQPVKPGTIATYHRHLKAFFNWMIEEHAIEVSPLQRIPTPVDRPDEVQPFTDAQVQSLLNATKRTQNPLRDEAILWVLLDTGLRATELCSLKFGDLDMQGRLLRVEGKGGKKRSVPFGKTAARALWNYLKHEGREEEDYLFESMRSESLTKDSLLLLLKRLNRIAGIKSVRVSPHTFRHTFAVSFLRNGGNQFSLMQILGHTNIRMTARYVQLAQADVQAQHRQFSPADRLKARR